MERGSRFAASYDWGVQSKGETRSNRTSANIPRQLPVGIQTPTSPPETSPHPRCFVSSENWDSSGRPGADLSGFRRRKYNNPIKFSDEVRTEIKERQGYKCDVLGIEVPLQVHHIIPRSHGGRGTIDNGVAVSHEVHIFLDKMAQIKGIYYDEIMEVGKEYIIGYLNATKGVQNHVIFDTPLPNPQPDNISHFQRSNISVAAGD